MIVFGKDARVESPPTPYPPSMVAIENTVDTENTDLAGALKLALASFPEDTARRLVVVSDGNENRGSVLEQALVAKGLKVQIDTLPIDYRYDQEVLVEKISMPPNIKEGETVNINVVLRASEPTSGLLEVFEKTEGTSVPLTGDAEPQRVELKRGLNVFSLKKTITQPNFYTFFARVHPRPEQRRQAGDEQHGRGVHRRPRRGPRPPDRRLGGRAQGTGRGPAEQGADRHRDGRAEGR